MIDPRTDCHCHILPMLDDGSASMAESVRLARRQAGWGFRKVVCTSHRVGKYVLNYLCAGFERGHGGWVKLRAVGLAEAPVAVYAAVIVNKDAGVEDYVR